MFLDISEPCSYSFRIKDEKKPVMILQENSSLYFWRDCKGLNYCTINFPLVGKYITVNLTNEEKKPLINYAEFSRNIKLPEPERQREVENVVLNFTSGIGKTPARIFAKNGLVQFNNDNFFDFPFEAQCFIFFHELGHIYYKTEKYCDLFALKQFLSYNLNPSQSVISLARILKTNDESVGRLELITNYIKKIQNQINE